MKIESILASKSSRTITIGPDRSLKEAVDLLTAHNIGALICVDEHRRPLGIISERDIVREAARNEGVLTQTVSGVMTQDPVRASPHDEVKAVLETMAARHIRHLPVMDRGQLIGIVSIGDLVKAQLAAYEGEVDTLQIQIIEGQD